MFVELPPDSEFAQARAPVTVTINGVSWESTVAGYSGRFYLPLRKGIREMARIAPGDTRHRGAVCPIGPRLGSRS